MKILVVSFYFYPENNPRAFRATALVKKLMALGYEVTLVIPESKAVLVRNDVDYNKLKIVAFREPFLLKQTGWQSIINKVIFKIFGSLLEKFYFPLRLLKNSIYKAVFPLSGFDLLISIAHPHSVHWGVSKAKRENGRLAKKWIGDSGDPFIGNPFNRRLRSLESLEIDFLQRCDAIAIPFIGAIDAYPAQFHSKIKIIPQGFDISSDMKLLKKYQVNSIPHFAYCGTFYQGYRDPSAFLDALCELQDDYRFEIFTSNVRMIQSYEKKSKGRIVIMQPIPRHKLLARLSQMDFLVNIENVGSVQLPSKLIDYAISGRPILSMDSHTVEVERILKFMKKDYSDALTIGDLGRYDVNQVVQGFLSIVNESDVG